MAYSPTTVRFGSADVLRATDLDDVLAASLGYTPVQVIYQEPASKINCLTHAMSNQVSFVSCIFLLEIAFIMSSTSRFFH